MSREFCRYCGLKLVSDENWNLCQCKNEVASNDIINVDQWASDSRNGKRCGMLVCCNSSKLIKCRLCEYHYCGDHINMHEDLVPHVVRGT